jgi:UDP-N-acetylglucosamine 4,6-dehydratase
MFKGKSLLITGGTGSFGKAFARFALDNLELRRIIIYSRDELKQLDMRREFADDSRLRWFIGDIREQRRLVRALNDVDFIVHAAALKQVDTAEYNPYEYVKTNVIGSQNVIDAAIDAGVSRVVALSTDKASSPINLYGATKLTADKLFISGNHYGRAQGTIFSVVRYGNVLNSRGSVIPFINELVAKNETIPVTHQDMTRFWITLDQAIALVITAFNGMQGGELYVPRIPSMKLVDLVKAVAPTSSIKFVGIRPGEKLHEEMISFDEGRRTVKQEKHFIILPSTGELDKTYDLGHQTMGNFAYTSDTNDLWLTREELRNLLEQK